MKRARQVWAVYSVFDASYSNRQSFGFFVDVGNGVTTIVPTVLLLVGMTAHGGGGFDLPVSARALGCVGLLTYWQELYGTCVYFFSFIENKRLGRRHLLGHLLALLRRPLCVMSCFHSPPP